RDWSSDVCSSDLSPKHQSFETALELSDWLRLNHDTQKELWVRIFKKHSRQRSVLWNDCVVAALAWGWIDSQKRSLDDRSYLQRLTPRRSASNWSKKNREHAERLIARGEMQPSGMVHVEAAKLDGRWENAYSGSSELVIPPDFVEALKKTPTAESAFEGLARSELFTIYHRLQTARTPETRARRMAKLLKQLSEDGKVR